MRNKERLEQEIVELSHSSTFEKACDEWTVENIWWEPNGDKCLCGKRPIFNVCLLQNKLNGNFARVGNCCVKKFMNIPTDRLFKSLKEVQQDLYKTLVQEVIDIAFKNEYITQWEKGFYENVKTKRRLTFKQKNIKQNLNQRIVKLMIKKEG